MRKYTIDHSRGLVSSEIFSNNDNHLDDDDDDDDDDKIGIFLENGMVDNSFGLFACVLITV
jgi:hypothetical protein